MIRYVYVENKEKELRFFWMGKREKTKKSVEIYMKGLVNWYDFYNIFGFEKIDGLCSCGTLWRTIKKLKNLGLIKHV